MRNELIAAASVVAAAIIGVGMIEERKADVEEMEPLTVQLYSAAPSEDVDWQGEEVRIAAAPDRHFYVRAEVNRSPSRFLIDTGASFVALRDSDARAAGIYTAYADFTYPVQTANGETKAAFVTLEEVEIEGLRIEGVKAFILQDDQLSVNLLGMSFLSRLESVEARKGELVLRG